MKQFLSVILILVACTALADAPGELGCRHIQRTGPIEYDYLIYSQTYSFDNLLNGYSNYGAGNRWVCDDFELIGHGAIYQLYVWIIWTGEQGTAMNFIISEDVTGDSNPNTNTDIWSKSVSCTNTFTGDSNWGYNIYEVHCNLMSDDFPVLLGGVHYYFETQANVADNCFILVSHNYIGDYCWWDNGSGEYVRSNYSYNQDSDMFFDFDGQISAMESETWGSIKTLF